jgi:hypothetical protein
MGAVMPVKTGIQVYFRFKFKSHLASGFRRNDENRSRLLLGKFSTASLVSLRSFN